jgi:hypothetical protein
MAAKYGIATAWLHRIIHCEPVDPAIEEAINPAPAPRANPNTILLACLILLTFLLVFIDNRSHNSIDLIGDFFELPIIEKLAY